MDGELFRPFLDLPNCWLISPFRLTATRLTVWAVCPAFDLHAEDLGYRALPAAHPGGAPRAWIVNAANAPAPDKNTNQAEIEIFEIRSSSRPRKLLGRTPLPCAQTIGAMAVIREVE